MAENIHRIADWALQDRSLCRTVAVADRGALSTARNETHVLEPKSYSEIGVGTGQRRQ